MSQLIYLSRNFVEFGPFKPEEIVDFKKRDILLESDYVRTEPGHHWYPIEEWLASSTPAAKPSLDGATPVAPEPEPPAKKAKSSGTKKKSGAKKAA